MHYITVNGIKYYIFISDAEEQYYKKYGFSVAYLYKIEIPTKSYKLPKFITYNGKKYIISISTSFIYNNPELEEINAEEDCISYFSNGYYKYYSINGVLYIEKFNCDNFFTRLSKEICIYPKSKKDKIYNIPNDIELYSIKDELLKERQFYLRKVIYKNKLISFDVDENYKKFNFKISPNIAK